MGLSPLATATTTATTLSNLILVSPQNTIGYQPQNPPNADGTPSLAPQPPALLFNYEGEQTASLDSDITDHFIEDNTALQDQIALRPPIITTHGFIGELNDIAPSFLAPVQVAAQKLTTVSAYTPSLSTTALIAYNTAFQLYQTAQSAINSAVAAYSSIAGIGGETVITGNNKNPVITQPNQTAQQTAFQLFYGYWSNRTLFTIQTPWAVFDNMAIKSLRAIQDADTNVITDFEVSFKQIRVASTTTSPSISQGRANAAGAGETNLGTSAASPSISLQDGMQTNYGIA